MNACPACSQPIGPNDLNCPKCGITLHHGTATAGPASGGSGTGLSVAAIVVIAVVGIVILVGCVGLMGAGMLFGVRSGAVMAPPPRTPPAPYSVPITAPITETSAPLESDSENNSAGEDSPNVQQVSEPPTETP